MGYKLTITNEGAALIASVTANQGTLTFTEMRFSETNYVGSEQTLTEGTFSGVFVTASEAASVIDSTTIRVSAHFDNSGITGDHPLYSIGIIGTDGNTTALIGVSTTSDPEAVIREPIPATSISDYAFNTNVTVSNTNDITVAGTTAAVLYDIDVVDTLISTATDKPLSANMGRVLKGNIDDNFSGQSNENFVDNPFFTINQRGTSGSYQNGYMADRWFAAGFISSNITTNITNNGAVIQSDGTHGWRVTQNIENYKDLSGRKVTYSINVKSISAGSIALFYAPSLNGINDDWVWLGNVSTTGIASVTFILPDLSSASGLCLMFQSDSPIDVTIRAVKLEPGSVSTLANDVAPDYAFELAKCQTSKADPLDTYANQGEIAVTSQLSNRNFLDNGWFTVNQRGATTVTSNGDYGADRWKKTGGTSITFSSSGVTLNGGQIAQNLEDQIPNGIYTASIKYSDGSIESGTVTKNNDTDILAFISRTGLTLGYVPSSHTFYMYSSGTVTVRALKLEVGTVSTLHLDTEPNYTTEYLKCRRYFKRFKGEFGIGCVREYATSPINFLFRIKIPNDVPMRSDSPSVVVNGDIRIPDYAGVYTSSDLINVSGAKNSSVINMDIYSNSTLPAQPMAKGMAANVDVYIFGPNDGTLDLVDEL